MLRLAIGKLRLARCDSPQLPFVITALLSSLFVFGMLHRTWQPAEFILAGSAVTDPARLPTEVPIIKDAPSGDGQYYFRLALNPFTRQPTAYGITLDRPPLRQ